MAIRIRTPDTTFSIKMTCEMPFSDAKIMEVNPPFDKGAFSDK